MHCEYELSANNVNEPINIIIKNTLPYHKNANVFHSYRTITLISVTSHHCNFVNSALVT